MWGRRFVGQGGRTGRTRSVCSQVCFIPGCDGGKQLTMKEAKALVAGVAPVPDETTRPATKKEIIVRLIRNLIARAMASENATREAAPYTGTGM